MEHVRLTPHSRVTIEYDVDAPNPRTDMECAAGCWTPPQIFGPRMSQGPANMFTFPGDLADAHERLWQGGLEPEANVRRWAWINHGIHLELHGWTYWFCDRNAFDALVGEPFTRDAQRSRLADEHGAYLRWERGDARTFTLERLARFKRVSPRHTDLSRDLLRVWEPVETVGGLYPEEGYQTADIIHEHFDHLLSVKEHAVVEAMIDEARAL